MCGIWSLVNLKRKNLDIARLFQDFYQLKHRGPDNSFFETYGNVFIGFHRLAIVDNDFSSNQPFIFQDSQRTVIFICNGEIYNYKDIVDARSLEWPFLNQDKLRTAQGEAFFDIYLGRVRIDGQEYEIPVFAGEAIQEILLVSRWLKQFILVANYQQTQVTLG